MKPWMVFTFWTLAVFVAFNAQPLYATTSTTPTTSKPAATTKLTTTSKPTASPQETQYSKLTKAIMSLHQRISVLEKASGKTTQDKTTQLQADLTQIKQELSTLKAQESFNRGALEKLDTRITQWDHKAKNIEFPDDHPKSSK